MSCETTRPQSTDKATPAFTLNRLPTAQLGHDLADEPPSGSVRFRDALIGDRTLVPLLHSRDDPECVARDEQLFVGRDHPRRKA